MQIGFKSCLLACAGGKRVEQNEQRQQQQQVVGTGPGSGRGGVAVAAAGTVPATGTAYDPVVPGAERGAEELGPGAAQVVPGEGESVVLPAAVADELRANVPENADVRGADRESHGADERVLGPPVWRQERDGPEGGEGRAGERHQAMNRWRKRCPAEFDLYFIFFFLGGGGTLVPTEQYV